MPVSPCPLLPVWERRLLSQIFHYLALNWELCGTQDALVFYPVSWAKYESFSTPSAFGNKDVRQHSLPSPLSLKEASRSY